MDSFVNLMLKMSFSMGILKKEVNMDLPPDFELDLGNNKMCKLKKLLYDLKQSFKASFEYFGKEATSYVFI